MTLLRGASLAPAGEALLGRVIDAFGRPLDDRGPLSASERTSVYAEAPGPLERKPIRERLTTESARRRRSAARAAKASGSAFSAARASCKSTLLGAMARASRADINVIALVGERNREVRAFLEDVLGDRALSRSVVVIAATSDKPAPLRVRAGFLAAAVADSFRAQGRDVLLDHGLGDPSRHGPARDRPGRRQSRPVRRGYTPSVFQMLPRVSSSGAGAFERGSVTALYTVLVEGDDMGRADRRRGALAARTVTSCSPASWRRRTTSPRSTCSKASSRLSKQVSSSEQLEWGARLRDAMAAYRRSQDLINLGAYAAGSNPKLDARRGGARRSRGVLAAGSGPAGASGRGLGRAAGGSL